MQPSQLKMLLVQLSLLLVIAAPRTEARCLQEDECRYEIVQSMPDGVDLKDPVGVTTVPTHTTLIEMVESAKTSLNVASFYWYLTAPEEFINHPTAQPGKDLMEAMKRASGRGVRVRIVLDGSGKKSMSNLEDVAELRKIGEVHFLNMTKLLKAGVNHSKYMIVDNSTLYIGSSNFDWRSYLQIKEIGLGVYNCPRLAADLNKIFGTYMLIAERDQLPDSLPEELKTSINLESPMPLDDISIMLGASPHAFDDPKHDGRNNTGRTDDIEGLLHVIERARKYIDISVMNYSPRMEFKWPHKYWPRIEDALRRAAIERGIRVRLLFSSWGASKPLETVWYNSLNAVQSTYLKGGAIHVKLFKVPAYDDFQKSIPFGRVKHDKYMVTDRDLYIGTSNWTPDYFENSCGVGIVIRPLAGGQRGACSAGSQRKETAKIVEQMQGLFERDFTSELAHELSEGL